MIRLENTKDAAAAAAAARPCLNKLHAGTRFMANCFSAEAFHEVNEGNFFHNTSILVFTINFFVIVI